MSGIVELSVPDVVDGIRIGCGMTLPEKNLMNFIIYPWKQNSSNKESKHIFKSVKISGVEIRKLYGVRHLWNWGLGAL